MIRAISSPSSSTTGFATLIFAINLRPRKGPKRGCRPGMSIDEDKDRDAARQAKGRFCDRLAFRLEPVLSCVIEGRKGETGRGRPSPAFQGRRFHSYRYSAGAGEAAGGSFLIGGPTEAKLGTGL